MNIRMPVLFVGHGSPMNALEENDWTRHLAHLGKTLPRPRGIVCVSAHWQTQGTRHLHVARPTTAHDFHGFPAELHKVEYPAPGLMLPELDWSTPETQWGFDHGTWSVLRHMYPAAEIPVTQISLDRRLGMREHLRLGSRLRPFRDQGLLVLASGNITHNLREVDFSPRAPVQAWAREFDQRTREALLRRDLNWLCALDTADRSQWEKAHPTAEHWWPLLYTVGASDETDRLSFPFEDIQNGSLAMRTVLYQS